MREPGKVPLHSVTSPRGEEGKEVIKDRPSVERVEGRCDLPGRRKTPWRSRRRSWAEGRWWPWVRSTWLLRLGCDEGNRGGRPPRAEVRPRGELQRGLPRGHKHPPGHTRGKEEVPENCLVETYEVVCASSFSCFSISSKAFWTSFSISSMGFGGGVVASA